jgi:hypothetical protein
MIQPVQIQVITCENDEGVHPKILTETDLRHIKRHICHDHDARQEPLSEII